MSRYLHNLALACATCVFAVFMSSGVVYAQAALAQGSFSGLKGHTVTGQVKIVKTDSGHAVKLGEDFSFDGAPDPRVALGKDGSYDPATLMGALHANSGKQSYAVPASVDVTDYNAVYIWCETFSVGLGEARLN